MIGYTIGYYQFNIESPIFHRCAVFVDGLLRSFALRSAAPFAFISLSQKLFFTLQQVHQYLSLHRILRLREPASKPAYILLADPYYIHSASPPRRQDPE